MSQKSLISLHSSLLKKSILFLLLFSSKSYSQVVTITEIHTDWKGYWKSNAITGTGNRPDDYNNLLAFKWNNIIYSTGVDDNTLTTKGVAFSPQKFRSLKIGSLGLNSSTYLLQGSMIDKSATMAILDPALAGSVATGAELASRLTDGSNGLSLGTGVANIKAGSAEFKIGTNNLNLLGIDDGTPDLIITQVADPGTISQADIFKFVDINGNTIGNEISVAFGSVAAVGTYSLDLFKADGGTNGFSPASTRDIRLVGIETKAFGITSSNAAQVDRFVINFTGSSDCAFIAFNTNSLKIAELSLIKTGSMSSCGKVGDEITYTFDVKNTGEVPISDIYITDPLPGMIISGGHFSSLAPNATTTFTGKYKITAADVTAGKVVNSAKVTGTDPSLNIVEDISGNTYTDNIPTTTNLLAPPTIGTITHASCNSLGKVVLGNLPSGNWILTQSGTFSSTISGNGTSFTVENLSSGTYNFRVKNSTGCVSPATLDVSIKDFSSTTWDGNTWLGGAPDASKNLIINSVSPNQPFTGDTTGCSLTINPGVIVTIPTGVTLTITNAVTTNGQLIFENNSSLIQTTNTTNTGNITYKRIAPKIRQADFVYWSTPVNPQKLINVSPNTLSDKYYGNDGMNWVQTDRNTNMVVGKGYIIRGPESYSNTAKQDYEASFIGVPNNGDLLGESLNSDKYYLIGNPYPSALSVDKLIDGNTILNGTVYLWTHNTPVNPVGYYQYNTNDYASYNRTGSIRTAAPTGNIAGNNNDKPNGFIAAGQSFFVSTLYSGQVIFKNSMREGGTNNNQFFKSAQAAKETGLEKNRIWLNMTNTEGAFKQLLVGYVEGATNNYENKFDGISLDGNPYLDFYSIVNTDKFAIQGRALPFADTDLVALGYRTTIDGDFTISIDEVDGKMNNQAIYIEDKTTGIIHDLKQSNYTFKTTTGTFTDRFVLRYTNKTLGTGGFENIEDGVLVSVKNKILNVISSRENIKEITLYDISGKQLYCKNKVGSTELKIQNISSGNQVLLVKITLNNEFTTTKKIIFE
nr:T9SS sorting signal type C domain-containing protein [Flavobacterium sp. ASV13]